VARYERYVISPGVQDTRQQLQATQQQLEAELQELAAQVSSAEMKLAAEPAKQRTLALQVPAITHASTLVKSKHHNLCFHCVRITLKPAKCSSMLQHHGTKPLTHAHCMRAHLQKSTQSPCCESSLPVLPS